MYFLNNLMNQNSYSLDKISKSKFFKKHLNFLTTFHYKKSNLYKSYLNGIKYNLKKNNNLSDIPFLPVRLFKEFDFLSIKKKEIYKTLLSSGTTSNNLSKIYMDKTNALNQIKVLQKIFNNLIGNSRLPMLVIDKRISNIDRNSFNASIAAINGFSIFANEIVYLLDHNNNINYKILNNFLKRNHKKKFLIFGFTSNVYINLIKKIDISKIHIKNLSNAFLIHGGGWKKIEEKKISRDKFNLNLNIKLGIQNIRNYYGLVEQIGSIFFECKCGYFIASNYSDIIIRDENLDICKKGEKGLVQLVSLLPTSYPGHSILTEDIGEIINDDNCKCYGYGTRFIIHGRLKNAELRGCSNI
jgi:phenylacetate-coenzyme A ligase PaaK-like adenylate-forming protein